jgi:hexosaminidase
VLKQTLTLALMVCAAGCTPESSVSPEALPVDIALSWEVVSNHHNGGDSFTSALTLTNEGSVPLDNTGWALYFSFGRKFVDGGIPESIRIEHINGDLFRLTPTPDFDPLPPGESLTLPLEAGSWVIKRSEAPTGFYFVFTDEQGHPSAPRAVEDVHIAPFEAPEQTDRMRGDPRPASTPASRYAENAALTLLPEDRVSRIVPTPNRVTTGTDTLLLDASWSIRYEEGLQKEAEYLAAALEGLLGQRPDASTSVSPGPKTIQLQLITDTGRATGNLVPEYYRLLAAPGSGILISGTDGAGILYGIQSLRALLPVAAYAGPGGAISFGAVTIEDAPRFGYRGLHLDVSRHFHSKASVLKLLDLMAFYKLNKFHFHLTDDEGWRLAIDGLPELTDIGARRGHTEDEHDHLIPAYGSGPDPDPSASNGSGFYTRADFIEILRFAQDRHIEVIPEVDVPGHARAAIKAMEVRAERLQDASDAQEATAYRLVDPGDTSTYESVQSFDDNVIDVCLPSTYTFLAHVIDDIVAMYEEAGVPLTTIHTGGDEVPHGVWEGSPACAALLQEDDTLEGPEDLAGYFLSRISALIGERGLVTAGWEEIALVEETVDGQTTKHPNPAFVGRNFRPYVWNNVWGWGGEANAYNLANAGYDVVLSNATNLYFDLSYNKDPEEPGYYWAGFVDTRTVYEFVPLDLYKSAWENVLGEPLDAEALYADFPRLTEEGRQHVLGIQGQLWSENAKSQDLMEYLAFPKLLALSERAWAAQPAWAEIDAAARRRAGIDTAWNAFANALGRRELQRLDHLQGGVNYRLPPPGAVIEDGMLKANTAFPGLMIRYTTDGSDPSASSPEYTGPVQASGTIKLRTFDTRGRGSRTATVR